MMKNIFKYISLTALVFAVGCINTNDDPRFLSNPEIGWVEMTLTSVDLDAEATSATAYMVVETPQYEAFNVNYTVTPVSGSLSNFTNVTSGTVTALPDNTSRVYAITIPLEATNNFRDFETVFEIELSGVNSSQNITLGGPADGNLVTTVTLPCNEPPNVEQLLDFDPDYLIGEYNLTDGTVQALDGIAGISRYFTTLDADDNQIPQVVTLFEGATPTERVFDAIVFNGLGFARIRTFTIELVSDPDLGNTVIFRGMSENNSTNLGCGIPLLIEPVPEEDLEDISFTQYEICNGGNPIEVNYLENSLSTCGLDPAFGTFILTPMN